MDLKKYFNSGSKKQDFRSETSTSGDDPKKIRDGSLDDSNNLEDVLLKDYLPLAVSIVYITVLRMLRIKYMAFIVKQKKPKWARLKVNNTLWI